MKYIIRVNSASEYGEDINTAFVDVDAELLKIIETRHRVFDLARQEDDTIYSMRYWCGDIEFFESDDDNEEYLEGAMLVPDDFSHPVGERIECLTMVVTYDGIHWTCYQKHCDIELRTDVLGYDVLKGIEEPAVLES